MATQSDDGDGSGEVRLRLFVSGATPRSMRAVVAVRKLCEARLAGHYSLEVIDIYRDPQAAREYQIVAVPTLIKLGPTPKRLFVGDLTDIGPLASGLGLSALPFAG